MRRTIVEVIEASLFGVLFIGAVLGWLNGTSPRFEARCRLVGRYLVTSTEERARELSRAFALVDHYQREVMSEAH